MKKQTHLKRQIQTELNKCKASPYYFFMTYMTVDGQKPSTSLTEEEFNREFKELDEMHKQMIILKRRNRQCQ